MFRLRHNTKIYNEFVDKRANWILVINSYYKIKTLMIIATNIPLGLWYFSAHLLFNNYTNPKAKIITLLMKRQNLVLDSPAPSKIKACDQSLISFLLQETIGILLLVQKENGNCSVKNCRIIKKVITLWKLDWYLIQGPI